MKFRWMFVAIILSYFFALHLIDMIHVEILTMQNLFSLFNNTSLYFKCFTYLTFSYFTQISFSLQNQYLEENQGSNKFLLVQDLKETQDSHDIFQLYKIGRNDIRFSLLFTPFSYNLSLSSFFLHSTITLSPQIMALGFYL